MGVKEEEIRELEEQALETFKKRFEAGPQKSEFAGKTIEELVYLNLQQHHLQHGAKQHWDDCGKESYPSTQNPKSNG
jgi:hypothetical protein